MTSSIPAAVSSPFANLSENWDNIADETTTKDTEIPQAIEKLIDCESLRQKARDKISSLSGNKKIHALSSLLRFDIRQLSALHPYQCDEDIPEYNAINFEMMKLIPCGSKVITKVFIKTLENHLHMLEVEYNNEGNLDLKLRVFQFENGSVIKVGTATFPLTDSKKMSSLFLINHSPSLKKEKTYESLNHYGLPTRVNQTIVDYLGYPRNKESDEMGVVLTHDFLPRPLVNMISEYLAEDPVEVRKAKETTRRTIAEIMTARNYMGEYDFRLNWYLKARSHIQNGTPYEEQFTPAEKLIMANTISKGDLALKIFQQSAESGNALDCPKRNFIPKELSPFTSPQLPSKPLASPSISASKMHPKEKLLKDVFIKNNKAAIKVSILILEYFSAI